MLLRYWERRRLNQSDWQQKLGGMGITQSAVMEVIEKVVAEKGETAVSVYHFSRYSGEPGHLVVCHDLGRGVISFGTHAHWGQWDESYEVLTVDGSGERFNFDGQPVDEGDEGSCSLGNI